MKTIVYVDGFNLYYRLLKGKTGVKWLDLEALIRKYLAPQADLLKIRYYTAPVNAKGDPQAPEDQQAYLNALRSRPLVEIINGRFLTSKKWAGLVHPPEYRPRVTMLEPYPDVVRIYNTEEKGSDVNLGVHLVQDAYLDRFDQAIILTNDTDLLEPMRIVIEDVGKRVGLYAPVRSPAKSLKDIASFVYHISLADARACQFPEKVPFGKKGKTAVRPSDWG